MLTPTEVAAGAFALMTNADSPAGVMERAWHTEPIAPLGKGARPKQLPPDTDWRVWLILAGRGFGKSRAVNEFAIDQAFTMPGSRGALVAATAGDVRDVIVEGESGIMAISPPDFMPLYEPSKRRLTWPNGSMATTYSADEPRRLRGPQHHWAICDELAAWRFPDAYDQLMLGLRLGDNPRVAISTTPRPTPIIKSLIDDKTVALVMGSTYENRENLADVWFDDIISRYEGTTLGRQELYAELLFDHPGALWTRDNIDNNRVVEFPGLRRIVVAIDPAVTAYEDSSETGIVVAGVSHDGHGYVLEDVTLRASPDGWAKAAVAAYNKYKADRIVAETNNGGDMVESTIKTVAPNVSFKKVHASRAKHTRAEPVAALYEQNRIHHVGVFGKLEDQLCQWVPGDTSPDRLDALVWAFTELMLDKEPLTVRASRY